MKSKIPRLFSNGQQVKCARKYLIYLSLFSFVGWLALVHNPFTSLCVNRRPGSNRALFRTNVLFLKTHKTASSTIQNIFMRFGRRHSLNFLLPRWGNYLGDHAPLNDTHLDESLTPLDHKFNIFAHHSRYHENTNRYLYDDTVRVTILRYPPSQFDSLYYFLGWDEEYNLTLPELLVRPAEDETMRAVAGRCNWMSHDLGLNRFHMTDENRIQDFVNYIDQQFDYVMITEYMEASLVMLAGLMGWPLEYVASVPLMMRTEDRQYDLTPDEESRLSALNKADTVLYNHNVEKFRKRIRQYGLTELTEGITKLRQINQGLAERCIDSLARRGYGQTVSYRVRDTSDSECKYATMQELRFTDQIRTEQIARLRTIKNVHKLVSAPSPKANKCRVPE